MDDLKNLVERARQHEMTPEERREQAISFAYGNTAIENPNVTREDVGSAQRKLERDAALGRFTRIVILTISAVLVIAAITLEITRWLSL